MIKVPMCSCRLLWSISKYYRLASTFRAHIPKAAKLP